MNFAAELFRLADSQATVAYGTLGFPRECVIPGEGFSKPSPRYLLVGSERQFHKWSAEIRRRLVTGMFDFHDRLDVRRQMDGLAEIFDQMFRAHHQWPALLWACRVWVRTGNWAQRMGLLTEDESCPTEWHGTSAAAHPDCTMRFGNGERIEIPVRKLRFFYPESSRWLLLTPRFRKLLAPGLGQVAFGYEEGLGLGNGDEAAELQQGNYTPNRLFAKSEHELSYLDLLTVTLARLYPDPPPRLPDRRRLWLDEPWNGRVGLLDASSFARLAELWQRSEPSDLPQRAVVRFVRVTFNPVDLSVVVVLTAERELPRFVADHDGLSQLLGELFAVPGMP